MQINFRRKTFPAEIENYSIDFKVTVYDKNIVQLIKCFYFLTKPSQTGNCAPL